MKKYPQIVADFYTENVGLFFCIAYQVKMIYKAVPLEISDLVDYAVYCLYDLDIQTDFYKERVSMKEFATNKLRYFMYSLCKTYTLQKHKIMNWYVEYDDAISSCEFDHYEYQDLFGFLSEREFQIIYDLKVEKLRRKVVAKKYCLTLTLLKNIEMLILEKIKSYIK